MLVLLIWSSFAEQDTHIQAAPLFLLHSPFKFCFDKETKYVTELSGHLAVL